MDDDFSRLLRVARLPARLLRALGEQKTRQAKRLQQTVPFTEADLVRSGLELAKAREVVSELRKSGRSRGNGLLLQSLLLAALDPPCRTRPGPRPLWSDEELRSVRVRIPDAQTELKSRGERPSQNAAVRLIIERDYPPNERAERQRGFRQVMSRFCKRSGIAPQK